MAGHPSIPFDSVWGNAQFAKWPIQCIEFNTEFILWQVIGFCIPYSNLSSRTQRLLFEPICFSVLIKPPETFEWIWHSTLRGKRFRWKYSLPMIAGGTNVKWSVKNFINWHRSSKLPLFSANRSLVLLPHKYDKQLVRYVNRLVHCGMWAIGCALRVFCKWVKGRHR